MSFLKRLGEKIKVLFILILLFPKLVIESWKVASARAKLDVEAIKRMREREAEEKKKNKAKK